LKTAKLNSELINFAVLNRGSLNFRLGYLFFAAFFLAAFFVAAFFLGFFVGSPPLMDIEVSSLLRR